MHKNYPDEDLKWYDIPKGLPYDVYNNLIGATLTPEEAKEKAIAGDLPNEPLYDDIDVGPPPHYRGAQKVVWDPTEENKEEKELKPFKLGGNIPNNNNVMNLQQAKNAGRFGDTELVHVNKEEKELLKQYSGKHTPTINPHTGLEEYWAQALIPLIPWAVKGIGKLFGKNKRSKETPEVQAGGSGMNPLAGAQMADWMSAMQNKTPDLNNIYSSYGMTPMLSAYGGELPQHGFGFGRDKYGLFNWANTMGNQWSGNQALANHFSGKNMSKPGASYSGHSQGPSYTSWLPSSMHQGTTGMIGHMLGGMFGNNSGSGSSGPSYGADTNWDNYWNSYWQSNPHAYSFAGPQYNPKGRPPTAGWNRSYSNYGPAQVYNMPYSKFGGDLLPRFGYGTPDKEFEKDEMFMGNLNKIAATHPPNGTLEEISPNMAKVKGTGPYGDHDVQNPKTGQTGVPIVGGEEGTREGESGFVFSQKTPLSKLIKDKLKANNIKI